MHPVILASIVVVLIGMLLFPSQAFSADIKPKVDFEKIKILKEKFSELKTKTKKGETIPVIIGLDTDFVLEGKLKKSDANFQKTKIRQDQDSLLSYLKNYRAEKIKKFEHLPFIAMSVDRDTLQRLETSPDIVMIAEDTLFRPSLAQSVPLIGAPNAWARGFSGQGQAVGILDTGVDKTHSTFAVNRVVSEACYSHHDPPNSLFTLCPNGLTADTSPGSGVPCSSIAGCDHGTHVAGIAAGNDVTYSGVAKDANIIAIQVFTKFTDNTVCGGPAACILAFNSDIVSGLDRIMTLSGTMDISSVNLSLGGESYTTVADCDGDMDNADIKLAVDNLRSKGIATVAAAGNEGSTNSLNTPACLSNVISVGSTTKMDAVSSFSNSASFLDLLAPGSGITSSVPGNTFEVKSGTSMSTPHVAGAWAVLKSGKPTATVTEVLNALKNTGVPIFDMDRGTFPRIQVDSALNSLVPPTGVPWYDDTWQFRKQITIDRTKVTATLTDFAVLISVTDADLTSAQADGDDILFTSSDGTTKLSHEIESWDDSTGNLAAWVKIPNLSSSTDTVLYMYYGNAAAANQENVADTWDSNYKIVTHLHSDTADSTINNNDGTNNGSTDGAGKIANGQFFDGINDDISFADEPSLDLGASGTFSIWVKSTDTLVKNEFAVNWDNSQAGRWGMYADPGIDKYRGLFRDSSDALIGGNPTSSSTNVDTNWRYIVATYDGTASRLYVDGVEQNNRPDGGKTIHIITNTGYLGKHPNNAADNRWEGSLDEFRVSNSARTAAWISTEYNNQNNPAMFYTVGLEETAPASPTVPGQITDLLGTPDDSKVALIWTAPLDGGSMITDYIIEFKESTDSTFTIFIDGVSTATTTTVTGLSNGISYDFRVMAVNAIGQGPPSNVVTEIPNPPPCPLDWFDCNWQFRKQITIDRTKVASTLTDFPVLISRTDTDLTSAQADGDDILFTSADGLTKLSHEIESWDDSTGELTAWIKVPSLSSSTDTKLYMYYGNTATVNQEDVEGTWDSNYKIVTHLHSDTSDSTSNNNGGTNNGSTDGTGKIANSQFFDGINDDISFTGQSSLDLGAQATISIWAQSTDTLVLNEFAFNWDDAQAGRWGMYASNGDLFRGQFRNDVGTLIGGAPTLSLTTVDTFWHYLTISYDGIDLRLYVDGVLEDTRNDPGEIIHSITNTGYLGKHPNNAADNRWEGSLDEFRVSNIARTANWISTEYNNQNNPATFYTVGVEET